MLTKEYNVDSMRRVSLSRDIIDECSGIDVKVGVYLDCNKLVQLTCPITLDFYECTKISLISPTNSISYPLSTFVFNRAKLDGYTLTIDGFKEDYRYIMIKYEIIIAFV